VIDDPITVTAAGAGNYQVTLTDLQLPQPLTTSLLAIAQPGGGSLVAVVPAGTPTSVNLPAGNYQIFAVGQADSSVDAGLFSVLMAPSGGGAPPYSKAVPIGSVQSLGTPQLTAGSYTLTVTDLALPAGNTLASASAVAVGAGQATPVA